MFSCFWTTAPSFWMRSSTGSMASATLTSMSISAFQPRGSTATQPPLRRMVLGLSWFSTNRRSRPRKIGLRKLAAKLRAMSSFWALLPVMVAATAILVEDCMASADRPSAARKAPTRSSRFWSMTDSNGSAAWPTNGWEIGRTMPGWRTRTNAPSSLLMASSRLTWPSTTSVRGISASCSESKTPRQISVFTRWKSEAFSARDSPIGVCGSGSGVHTARLMASTCSQLLTLYALPSMHALTSCMRPSISHSMKPSTYSTSLPPSSWRSGPAFWPSGLRS